VESEAPIQMASPHSHSAMNLYGNFKKSMKIKIEANQTRKKFLLNGFQDETYAERYGFKP
jgi:hypothetical protein